MWPLPSSLTWWEQAVLFMFAIQACQTSLFPNWLGSYQFISFQNKSRLIWATEGKMFSRSGNSFAWHFQSWIVLLQIYILLLSFTIWVQRSESILKVFFPPQAARQHLSSDVYLGSAEHPSFWLFDSCESQDDLILSWVAEPYLDSNWVCFAGYAGQMFVSSSQIVCSGWNWCLLCMFANKHKKTQAWTGATLLCLLSSMSV